MRIRCENCNCNIEFVDISKKDPQCPSCGSLVELSGSTEETVTELQTTRSNFLHFELMQRLGAGHFGTVWKARDTRLDRIVAIKMPNDVSQKDQQPLFFREAQAAARLDHPNIVAVYEVGIDEVPYISSKFIDGVSLREGMDRFKGDYKAIATIVSKIASALAHSHENGIIHRDLKPANILIDSENNPYVTDFGLAKRVGADVTIAKDGAVLGTPAYMPPEQAEGRVSEIDARSDIYSLGVILYEMLSGRRPFTANTQRALLFQIVNDEPPIPKLLKGDIPSDLSNVCLKAIEKSPSLRYQTAIEFREDLDRFLRHESVLAKPWPWHRKAMRVVKKHRNTIVVSTLIGCIAMFASFAMIPKHPDWWNEAKTVLITTEPVGAKCVFMPIDLKTGLPILGREIALPGKSPFKTKLPPGTFRVTAWKDDSLFHEVVRTIPEHFEELPLQGSPNSWKFEKNGDIKLPSIQLFPQDRAIQGMILLPPGKTDRPEGDEIVSDGFYVSMQQATVEDLRQRSVPIPAAMKREGMELDPNAPIAYVNFWQAMWLDEKLGWSPSLDIEYDYAFGYLRGANIEDPQIIQSMEDAFEEWSGPAQFVPGRFAARGDKANHPGGRAFYDRFVSSPNLGFRGFRPMKPRIRASDFTRPKEAPLKESP